MPPLVRFIISRLLAMPVTLLIVTAVLYGFIMMTPPEVRAELYYGQGVNPDRLSPAQMERIQENIIRRYHLRDPFPVSMQFGLAVCCVATGAIAPRSGTKCCPL